MSTTGTSLPHVKSKDAWKKAATHTVALYSGVTVDIRIPNLPQMVKANDIPNDLLDAALGAMKKQEITPELIKEQADFFHLMVATMVVAPELTPDEVPDVVPYEDIELLVEIGTRQRDIDALGHHIAGLHKSAEWRKFRGWDLGDETVEDV